MWLISYLESILDSCDSFQQTKKETTMFRTFVKLKVYCKFCCVQPEDWPWQFYADRASSLMSSLHEHCHPSTADNSYPTQCYIANNTTPENQTPQLVHSVNCDNDWDNPHFPKQLCKNIHLFIHFIFLKTIYCTNFPRGKLADNPTPAGEWV